MNTLPFISSPLSTGTETPLSQCSFVSHSVSQRPLLLFAATVDSASSDEEKEEEKSSPLSLSQNESSFSPSIEVEWLDKNMNATNISNDNQTNRLSLFQRIKRYFFKTNTDQDNLTFRQRLAKMGLAAVLSYGWVSNMSYSVTVSLAWYLFSKQTGKSPLAPGQWKGFLAVYAGFWMFNNIVRPARLAIAVAISPTFDGIVLRIQQKLKVPKATAITVTVIIANVFGTFFFMSLGILLASLLAGVPIFAR